MSTYRYRLKFLVHASGIIQHDQSSFDFEISKDHSVRLVCFDDKIVSNGKVFVLTSGGFDSREEATTHGLQLKTALLIAGPTLRMGIDTGKDTASGKVGKVIKEMILEDHGVVIIDDVHGLLVYPENYPVSMFSTLSARILQPSNVDAFTSTLTKIANNLPRQLSEKENLCLELYGASHFEKSERARFLTLIFALEALIMPTKRAEEVRQLIDIFVNLTQQSDLTQNDKASIIGSLQWLYDNSISRSLKDMARTYTGDKEYNGLSATKFISLCYDARSQLVHNGKVINEKTSLGSLAAQLEVFVADILKNKLGVSNLQNN